MGKPSIEVFEAFKKKYFKLTEEAGLEQYLVPYLMSSHPGSTMNDAVEMALWLKKWGYLPEQVQDFYPTPGTISTVMYYTGINPMTGKRVYVTTDYHEKKLQRALLQYSKPENANLVREALTLAGREDLIGNGPEFLVRPAFGQGRGSNLDTRNKNQKNGKKATRGRVTSSESQGKRGKGASNTQNKRKVNNPLQNRPKKSTKLDRIFGEDAGRIKREAARMTESKSSRSTTGKGKTAKKGKNTKRG